MKKKMLMLLLAGTLALSLCACGSGGSADSGEATEPQEPEAPAVTDAGTFGDYDVAIGDCTFGEDYEGNPIIVIHYSFTNNGEEPASALWSLGTKAYQDGVELETAIVSDTYVYDASIAQKDIKTGITLDDCQIAYVMTSDSLVEFEIPEFLGTSNDTLYKTFEVNN